MRWQWNDLSLRSKLMVSYSLLTLIGIMMTAVTSYVINNNHVKEIIRMSAVNTTQLISANIDNWFSDADRLSIKIASNPDIQMAFKSKETMNIVDYLTLQAAAWSNLQGIYVMDENGHNYYTSKSYRIIKDYDFSRESWAQQIHDDDYLIMGTHLEEHVYSNPIQVYSIARMIRDAQTGRKLGFVKLDWSLNNIENLLYNNTNKIKGELMILDRSGHYFFHQNHNLLGYAMDPDVWNYIQLHGEQDNPLIEINNHQYQLTVNLSKITGLRVISLVPNDLLSNANSITNGPIVIIILLGFIISLIFSVVVSMSILRPIIHLRRNMKKVERGDLTVKMQVETRDEIGELTNSFNVMLIRLQDHIDQIYNYQIVNKQAQLEAIRAKINPHFLYNTLETIDTLASIENNETVSKMIRALSSIFEYSITAIDGTVTIQRELQNTESYLFIQNTRFQNRYNIDIINSEPFLDNQVLPFILQPTIENAFKHGFERKLGKGNLRIEFIPIDGILQIHIIDDGPGINLEKWEELDGQFGSSIIPKNARIGLKSVHERLRLTYGPPYGLEIMRPDGYGFHIIICIPNL